MQCEHSNYIEGVHKFSYWDISFIHFSSWYIRVAPNVAHLASGANNDAALAS